MNNREIPVTRGVATDKLARGKVLIQILKKLLDDCCGSITPRGLYRGCFHHLSAVFEKAVRITETKLPDESSQQFEWRLAGHHREENIALTTRHQSRRRGVECIGPKIWSLGQRGELSCHQCGIAKQIGSLLQDWYAAVSTYQRIEVRPRGHRGRNQ